MLTSFHTTAVLIVARELTTVANTPNFFDPIPTICQVTVSFANCVRTCKFPGVLGSMQNTSLLVASVSSRSHDHLLPLKLTFCLLALV